jgi:hypothetical protein
LEEELAAMSAVEGARSYDALKLSFDGAIVRQRRERKASHGGARRG